MEKIKSQRKIISCFSTSDNLNLIMFNILRKLQACKDTFGNTNMTMVIAPGQICDKFFGDIQSNN